MSLVAKRPLRLVVRRVYVDNVQTPVVNPAFRPVAVLRGPPGDIGPPGLQGPPGPDPTFSNLAGVPDDNAALTEALAAKQDASADLGAIAAITSISGYLTKTGAGTWALNTSPHVNLIDAVKTDGSDQAATIQAAIDALPATGGTILLPPGTVSIASTLVVISSNIAIQGFGGGYNRQGTSSMQASAATRLRWIGPVGGTMMRFQSPALGNQNMSGGGMRGIMLDGNNFTAAVGLEIRTWRNAVFEDCVFYACSQDQCLLGVVDYALADPLVTQKITFRNCVASTFGGSGTYLTSTATGWRMTGGSSVEAGNTCFCNWYDCNAYMSKGVSYYFENSDNCVLYSCSGKAAYDANVYAVEFGSSDQDTGPLAAPARANQVIASQLKIRCRASQNGGRSAENIHVIGLSRENNNPLPVVELGAGGSPDATCYVLSNDGLSFNQGAPVANQISNPRFDEGGIGFAKSPGWTFAKDPANAESGYNVWSHAGTTSGADRVLGPERGAQCAPGDIVYASARMKASGLAGKFLMQIKWLDAVGGTVSTSKGTANTADTGYMTAPVEATAPAGAVSYKAQALVNKTAGTVYVDRMEGRVKVDAATLLTNVGLAAAGSGTVAALPAAATVGKGARWFVTDATATTFMSIVAGGGTKKVPVVSDGTNWLIG